jgi:hypothetical protein
MRPTHDSGVFLVADTPEHLEFWCLIDGDRWRIYGKCSQCSACYGDLPMPMPGAEHVVRPEIAKLNGCTLTGEYL